MSILYLEMLDFIMALSLTSTEEAAAEGLWSTSDSTKSFTNPLCRSGILDKYEKLLMYLFPYGWKVNTPATDETGMYVVRLVGLFLVLVIIFDILLAWHINMLQWDNHFFFFCFILMFIAIIGIVLIISRQPQIRFVCK